MVFGSVGHAGSTLPHIYGSGNDNTLDGPAGDGVHCATKTFAVFGKAGDHGRLQAENCHHGRDEIQCPGGGQNGIAPAAEFDQIYNSRHNSVKGVEGRQVDHKPG